MPAIVHCDQLPTHHDGVQAVSNRDIVVDVFTNKQPFDQLLKDVSRQYGINVIYGASLDSVSSSRGIKKEVSVKFKGALSEFLVALSSASGFSLSLNNGVVSVGVPANQLAKINFLPAEKGSTFGDVLLALYKVMPFSYSIVATTAGTSSVGQSASPTPSGQYSGQQQPGQRPGSALYDIPVTFAYHGDSVDEAVQLLCKAADVYCEKIKDVWTISKYEVYIVDKSMYWTYSLGSGGSSGSTTGTTGSSMGSGSATPSSSSTSGTVGGVSSSASYSGGGSGGQVGNDTVGISGNYDDIVSFVKSYLSKDGVVQVQKGGYIVVMDTPSSIERVRKIMARDSAADAMKVRVKVSIVSIQLNNDFNNGVDWNAVVSNMAVGAKFSSANRFTFAYDTLHKGNPIQAMVGLLSTYGKTHIGNEWEYAVENGVPLYYDLWENIPTFQTTSTTNNTATQLTTNAQYVPVGLMLKIFPNLRATEITGAWSATLSQLKSMATSGTATAPDTTGTTTAGTMRIPYGSTCIVTGFKTTTDSITNTGLPVLSNIPLIGALFGNQQKNKDTSELAVVISVTKEN